jgi:hypothetical protein
MDERHLAGPVGGEGAAVTAIGIDPAVHVTVRLGLSLLLLWAANHKRRDVAGFRSALASYQLLPATWIGPCAIGLIVAEIGVTAGLWLPGLVRSAGVAAAGLFTVYAVAIVINLLRGRRDIDCGCAGGAGDRPLSGALVLRNGVLVSAAGMVALPTLARPLMWLDAITISAGVATLALLYAAADALLVHAPKIAVLAGEPVARRLPAEGRHA